MSEIRIESGKDWVVTELWEWARELGLTITDLNWQPAGDEHFLTYVVRSDYIIEVFSAEDLADCLEDRRVKKEIQDRLLRKLIEIF